MLKGKPLVVQKVPASPPPYSLPGLLESFIYPCKLHEFVGSEDVFSAARAFTGGGKKRVDALVDEFMCGGDLEALLNETPSELISAWFVEPGTGIIQTLKLADPATALTAYRCGASLYFRAPQALADAIVPDLGEDLGMLPCAIFHDTSQGTPRGEVETFATRKGHVTGWHTDFQHNFTLQLSGKKKWRFKRGAVLHPLRALTPHYATPGAVVEEQFSGGAMCGSSLPAAQGEELMEVILSSGDALWFPAGLWHTVECLEDSLSINASLVGLTWADICGGVVRQILWKNPVMREFPHLPPLRKSGGVRKRRRADDDENHDDAHHQVVALQQRAMVALGELQSAVRELCAFELIPPSAVLSKRKSAHIPGASAAAAAAEEEDEYSGEGTGKGGPPALEWYNHQNDGYKLRFDEDGQLHVLVPPPPPPPHTSSTSKKGVSSVEEAASLRVKKSATVVVLPFAASRDYQGPTSLPPASASAGTTTTTTTSSSSSSSSKKRTQNKKKAEESSSPLAGYSSYLVFQNFGTTGEDLTPLLRAVLHLPSSLPCQALLFSESGKEVCVPVVPQSFGAACKFLGIFV